MYIDQSFMLAMHRTNSSKADQSCRIAHLLTQTEQRQIQVLETNGIQAQFFDSSRCVSNQGTLFERASTFFCLLKPRAGHLKPLQL